MKPVFETVQLDPGASFHLVSFGCDDFAADHMWHYHSEYELTWITRSSGTRFVGNSIRRYDVGDLVLVGPDLPHCWHNDPSDGEMGRPELILMQFDRSFLGEHFFTLPEVRSVRALLNEAQNGLYFPPEVSAGVGQLMRSAERAFGLERLVGFLRILGSLAGAPREQLATSDYRAASDINPVNRGRIEMVHRYVRDHLDGDICQAEIAARLNMRPSAFSKFFRAATGHTFVGFVNAVRLNEACRLLAASDRGVTQIAMECGYNNLSNFNRRFLQLKGATPTEYRRRSETLKSRRPVASSPPRQHAAAAS